MPSMLARAAFDFKKRVTVLIAVAAVTAATKKYEASIRRPTPRALRVLPLRRTPMNWQSRLDSLNEPRFIVSSLSCTYRIFVSEFLAMFQARMRMNKAAFAELADKIRPFLPRKKKTRKDAVSVEVGLSMTLRWLAGGSYVFLVSIILLFSPLS